MKVLLIDTDSIKPEIIETEGGLKEWRSLLKCDSIDISYLQIQGRYFDFIIDDCGLMRQGAKVTAIDGNQKPQLVGSLIICNYDGNSGESSLTEDDINHIMKNLVILSSADPKKPERWLAVNNVEP